MQPVEALTLLIAAGDANWKFTSMSDTDSPRELTEYEQQLQLAVTVCQAMLNTALPVARFRCFVRMESGKETGREFTICSANIEDIAVALYPMSLMSRFVYIALWEQRSDGASMLEGYQGNTRPGSIHKNSLRKFIDGLRKYSGITMVN